MKKKVWTTMTVSEHSEPMYSPVVIMYAVQLPDPPGSVTLTTSVDERIRDLLRRTMRWLADMGEVPEEISEIALSGDNEEGKILAATLQLVVDIMDGKK